MNSTTDHATLQTPDQGANAANSDAMTRKPPLDRVADKMADRIADRDTPFVADCWYVAAWSRDITRTLLERTILGKSVVMYRGLDGKPIALQNRCPHRSMPLSRGSLEGDVVRCGYHGLAFEPSGACVGIPQQKSIPKSVCVRAYPLAERGPFVWIWTGDASAADESLIPDTSWLVSPEWSYATNYVHLESSYVGLHENLMDLTHFTYLHPTTLGTPEYATMPFESHVEGDKVCITRLVPECVVPPIYKRTGIQGKMSRYTVSEFLTPAVHHASAVMKDLNATPGKRDAFTVYITHFVTPETQDSAHYWFSFARDFCVEDEEVTQYMGDSALTAFNEDLVALHEIARMHALEPDSPKREIHIKSDAAGLAVRRVLRRLSKTDS